MSETEPPLRISPEEAWAAVPPPARARPAQPPPPEYRAEDGGLSHLAVGSLVLALAGVPLVGCLLGPLAVVTGALAVASIAARPERRGMRLAYAGILLGFLDFAGWGVGIYLLLGRPAAGNIPPPPPTLPTDLAGPADLDAAPEPIQRALRANVRLQVDQGLQSCQGSGVLVEREGERLLILTNRHVAHPDPTAPPNRIQASFADGSSGAGTVAWLAPGEVDVALVEVVCRVGPSVVPVPVEAQVPVQIGDQAFAIGNPLSYQGTYTAGPISSLRTLRVSGHSLRVYQTQAPVNPGNSGGGLYLSDGRLIGLNTWATEKSVSEGLGFAIAVDGILRLLEAEGRPLRLSSPGEEGGR